MFKSILHLCILYDLLLYIFTFNTLNPTFYFRDPTKPRKTTRSVSIRAGVERLIFEFFFHNGIIQNDQLYKAVEIKSTVYV